MKNVTEIFVLIIYLAMLFVLVRPQSNGPTLVENAGSAFEGVLSAATGGGSW
jgi:hypothetical protein